MAYAFYYGAHGVMVVYDCTDQKSFNNVKQWLHEIDQHAFNGSKLIIGNKCDLSTKKVIDHATVKVIYEYSLITVTLFLFLIQRWTVKNHRSQI